MIEWLLTNTPLVFLTQSIWRDEAFSYLMARQPFFSIFASTAQDFNPPLYYLLLNLYMKVFGHSEIALRAFSLIFFNILIYTVYLFVERIFSNRHRSKWIYISLFASSPFLLYYGLEARMYAMTAALTTVSWYFLFTHRPRRYLATVIMGIFTHYFFLLVVASQVLYKLFSKSSTRAQKVKFIKVLVPAGIAFLLWVVFLFTQHPISDDQFWIVSPPITTLLNTPGILLTGYEDSFGFPSFSVLPYTLLFVVTIILGFRTTTSTSRSKDITLALVLWTVVPVVITIALLPVKPLFLPRYLLICAPAILLLAIYFLMHVKKPAIRLLLVVLYFVAFAWYHHLQITYRTKADFRATMKEINSLAQPGDVIYVENELNFHPAQFYTDPERVYIFAKPYEEIPNFVGRVLIPKDRMVYQPPQYPRKAFIIHEDLSYGIQSIY